jgi:hypothetical protein
VGTIYGTHLISGTCYRINKTKIKRNVVKRSRPGNEKG